MPKVPELPKYRQVFVNETQDDSGQNAQQTEEMDDQASEEAQDVGEEPSSENDSGPIRAARPHASDGGAMRCLTCVQCAVLVIHVARLMSAWGWLKMLLCRPKLNSHSPTHKWMFSPRSPSGAMDQGRSNSWSNKFENGTS